ncbi:MAG: histidine kinase, partial [Comamonadaceae bacterium CG17_big_fil_post_rev_8_21_14_2_50_60_13]
LLAIHQGAQEQVLKAADLLGIDLSGVDDLASQQPAQVPVPAPADPLQQRMSEEIRNRALVSELSQLFARQEDQAQLLESVRQNARILFDLEDTAVFMLNTTSQTLVGVSMGEQRQRLADFAIALSAGGVIAESALQKRVVAIKRNHDLLNMTDEQLLRAFGTDCLLCLPIASGARCWGMLFAGVPAWRAVELLRQEKFLLAFGAQAANALNAGAHDRSQVSQQIDKLREEQLENSRKVVHEVNNPLSIIKNYLGVLDDKLARQQPVGNEISILNEEIDRVGSIIKEFAGVKPAASTTDSGFDMNRVINDIVRLFRESKYLPAGVKITSRVVDRACEVGGAPETLKQILVNLIK